MPTYYKHAVEGVETCVSNVVCNANKEKERRDRFMQNQLGTKKERNRVPGRVAGEKTRAGYSVLLESVATKNRKGTK